MRNKLFIRLICASLAVTLGALLIVGFFFLRTTYTMLNDRQVNDLRSQAETLTGLVKDLAGRSDRKNWISDNFLLQLYYIAKQSNSEIWILYDGVSPLQGYDKSQDWVTQSIDMRESRNVFADRRVQDWTDAVRTSGKQEEVTRGKMDGLFSEEVVSYGMPIYREDRAIGVVAIHTRANSVSDIYISLSKEVLNVFLIAALFALVLLSFITESITRPLVKMSGIVSEYAQGKFNRRMDVKGKDEIAQLAENLNRMADDLRNIESLRRDFVANVSHELRTPMTSMRGFVQAMIDGVIPDRDFQKYLVIVRDETERLSKMVNTLLDLSRLESGTLVLNITRFEINECLRRVLIRMENAINSKKLDVKVSFEQDPCYCVADMDRIEQVVINLLDNAIKFSPQGGMLKIQTYALKDIAYISVSDSGPGISQEDLRFIWERFYKADKSHSSPGTGLGLSIVKRIIDEHGQQISAIPRMYGGITFQFTLARMKE